MRQLLTRQYRQVKKFATAIEALSLIGAFFIAGNHPGTGAYEVSIYQAYPLEFWIFISATIIIGQLAIWIQISSGKRTYAWVYPLALIVLANTLVLSLPYLRHYAFASQWDDVNHFASTMSILDYGRPDPDNFYPASHLLAAAFSRLTGLDLHQTVLLFSPIFYAVYLANMAFAAWMIDDRPGVRGLILSLSLPLGYNTFSSIFRPTHFAVYMLPLLFGWLYKTRLQKGSWLDSIPFLLILIYLPFLHPWAVISSAFLILAFILGSIVTNSKAYLVRQKPLAAPGAILVITWVTWFSSHQIFGPSIRRVLNSFNQATTGSHSFVDYVHKAQSAHLPWDTLLSLVLFTYGPTILYLAMGGIVAIWVVVRLGEGKTRARIDLFALSIFTAVFSLIALSTLFRDLISEGPLRFTNFVFAMVPLLAARFYYDQFFHKDRNGSRSLTRSFVARMVLYILVVSTALPGILSTYYSPLTGQPNQQFSYAQQAGTRFLLERAVQDKRNIYSPFGGAFTLSAVMNSVDLARLRGEQPHWWIKVSPDHFGSNSSGAAKFENPGYLFVTAPEKAYYTEVWPHGGRIVPEDFRELSDDASWHQIYQSGDMTLWQRATPP